MRTKSRKSNKAAKILVFALAAFLLASGAFWLKQYYDDRYAIEDYYYTVVPLDYDCTPERAYSSDGKYMGLEKEYSLTCYSSDGKERTLEFKAFLSMQDLYPPGTYVKVSASRKWATGKRALAEADVPETALAMIKEHFIPSSASTLSEYAGERTRQLSAWASSSTDAYCAVAGSDLVYTYIYGAEAKELALSDSELLDPVYKAQFRTDKEAFPELGAIRLLIKLEDGTVVFSKEYDKLVKFGYEM